MSVLLEFAMFPTDKGVSVSEFVARIIKNLETSGYNYQLTPMGTIVETDTIEQALDIVKDSYYLLEKDCSRVYSSLKFDIRSGQQDRMLKKMESIKAKL